MAHKVALHVKDTANAEGQVYVDGQALSGVTDFRIEASRNKINTITITLEFDELHVRLLGHEETQDE